MAKRFSPEFKQQAIDYALSNSHESHACHVPMKVHPIVHVAVNIQL